MLRWIEGFQGQANSTIFGRLYTNVSGLIDNVYTDEFGRSQFISDDLSLRTPVLVGAVENTWFLHFGFVLRASALNTSPSAFPGLSLRNSVGEQLRIEAVEANESKPGGTYYKMRVMRGATELARTVQKFSDTTSSNHRTYFQFKAVVRTSTNGSFELKYNTHKGGVLTATWSAANTGVNTANQGTDGADRAAFNWTTGDTTDQVGFQDIVICDNTGSKNNDYLGSIYIEALDPSANGNELDWVLAGGAANITAALGEIATTQTVGNDDSRITSDTVGDISLVAMTDLSRITETTIIGMQVRLAGKMETVGTRDVQFFYRKTTGTPAQVGTGILDLDTTSIVAEADTQENDPNTATDWVIADINGIQLGVELDA